MSTKNDIPPHDYMPNGRDDICAFCSFPHGVPNEDRNLRYPNLYLAVKELQAKTDSLLLALRETFGNDSKSAFKAEDIRIELGNLRYRILAEAEGAPIVGH